MVDLDAFAQRTAIRMKAINVENTASIEVLKYGLLVFINSFSVVFISLLIGFFTGKFMETLLALAAFALLRACTGGPHLKSSIQCIIISSALMSTIPHILMNNKVVFFLTITSSLIILFFAPFGIENQSNIPKSFYPFLKVIGVMLVVTNLIFISNTLAACFFLQSILLIRWKGGKQNEENSST